MVKRSRNGFNSRLRYKPKDASFCVFYYLWAFLIFASMQGKWFNQYRAFWYPILAGILALAFLVLGGPKGDTFLFLQLPHSRALNFFFSMITWLGDGLFCILVVIIMALFVSLGRAATLLSGFLAGSILVQFTKHFIFENAPRPVKWFELNHIVQIVPSGLEPHLWNSFPSGHSATGIALFFFLATQVRSIGLRFLLGLLALLTGYSRIYLYMHFPEDVLGGFIIGILTMVPVWTIWDLYLKKTTKTWLHKPLLKWKS